MLTQDLTGRFVFTPSSPSTRGSMGLSSRGSTRTGSPFALDDEFTTSTDLSRSSLASRGYRDGGPKEARLRRVAFLSKIKEIDHLFPMKVENIPDSTDEDQLREIFSEFGEIGDLYLPKDTKNIPLSNFAIVRFTTSDAREKALLQKELVIPERSPKKQRKLSLSPLKPQPSFFSKGTGYHGICNIPIEDGYDRKPVQVQQDINLSSCRSRSGYPWGSVRELKFLAPHPPEDATFSYAIRLDDVPRDVTEEELKFVFERFGPIVSVNCPKPLIVTQQTKDPNCGFGFVRFQDPRDRQNAFDEISKGNIKFRDQSIKGKIILPSFWPTQETRRYY